VPEPAKPVKEESQPSLLWWALGLLVTGILVLGLGTVILWRVISPQVDVIRSTSGDEVKAPSAPAKANLGDDTGLPRYPGADVTEPGTTVEIDSPAEDDIAVTVAKFSSSDAVDKVDAWYKDRLGEDFEREGAGRMERKRVIYGTEVFADDVAFFRDREHVLEAVILRRKGAVTEIVLLRAGEPTEE